LCHFWLLLIGATILEAALALIEISSSQLTVVLISTTKFFYMNYDDSFSRKIYTLIKNKTSQLRFFFSSIGKVGIKNLYCQSNKNTSSQLSFVLNGAQYSWLTIKYYLLWYSDIIFNYILDVLVQCPIL